MAEEIKGADSGPGQFGHFQLLEEIGHGGMGIVYRARDTALNRPVALKLILAGPFAGQKAVKRFRVEAEAAARLDHPNIVPIYEVGEQDGRPFYSMKFMEGGTLAGWLALHGEGLDARKAVGLLAKVARAVHHAHQRAVVHRDLKPGNILLDGQGEPHVSDFGIAKWLDRTERMTQSDATLGSPSYMSPEQTIGPSDELTTASDTYSLGALLYHLLTGRPPFQAATALATMEMVLRQDPAPLRTLRAAVDPDLETICLKCLEKNPRDRYSSADALAEELERWLRGEPIQARPCPPAMRLWKWMRRRPGTATFAAIAVLATVGFVVGQAIMNLRLSRANTEVRTGNARLEASLYELRWRQVEEAARSGARHEAIAWLSSFLRQAPSDAVAVMRLLSLLSSANFPLIHVPTLVHEAPVRAVEFNQAGDRLVSTTAGRVARVWNTRSGAMEAVLDHPSPVVESHFVGRDDQKLLTISEEPKLRLWDLGTGRIVHEQSLGSLNDRAIPRRRVEITADRQRVAVNIQSNAIVLLDANSGAPLRPEFQRAEPIHRFALSADGQLLAAATFQVRIWETENGREPLPPVALDQPATALRFSEDGRWLAYSCKSGYRVMSTVTGESGALISIPTSTLVLVANSGNIVSSFEEGTPRAFDFRTGQDCGAPFGNPRLDWERQRALDPLRFPDRNSDRAHLLDPASGRAESEGFFHDGWIVDAKLDPEGRLAATASLDHTVRLWSIEMGAALPITLQAGTPVYEAQWSPSGDAIMSTSFGEAGAFLQLWNAQTGRLRVPVQPLGGVAYFAAWAPDGTRFATGSQDFTARIWDGKTGQPLSPPLPHDGVVVHSVFSPTTNVLATGADDASVRLWNSQTGQPIAVPMRTSHTPLKLAFSRDGHRLAAGCEDGSIRVWSVPDGHLVLGPLQHQGTCWLATFSPDDRWLLSASSDGTAQLWDPATGRPALPPFRHEGPVLWASFHPDGKTIATSTDSGIVRVWNTRTGRLLAAPMRHPGKVWFVRWSPDGQWLATTCTDGKARIWDAATGRLLSEPFAHQPDKQVRRAEFSPDGRRLLTASLDGTIKIWDLALLRPPLPAPSWLPELAEALGGKRVGPRDALVTVSADSLERVRKTIAQAHAQGDDFYTRWAKWMLEDRLQRPVPAFQP
jgi:WD40 repeat protein